MCTASRFEQNHWTRLCEPSYVKTDTISTLQGVSIVNPETKHHHRPCCASLQRQYELNPAIYSSKSRMEWHNMEQATYRFLYLRSTTTYLYSMFRVLSPFSARTFFCLHRRDFFSDFCSSGCRWSSALFLLVVGSPVTFSTMEKRTIVGILCSVISASAIIAGTLSVQRCTCVSTFYNSQVNSRSSCHCSQQVVAVFVVAVAL